MIEVFHDGTTANKFASALPPQNSLLPSALEPPARTASKPPRKDKGKSQVMKVAERQEAGVASSSYQV
jgi:hypothetical protein